MMEKLKDRYTILAISFILFGIIIISQLVNLQIIHGKDYDEQSQRRLLKERKIVAPRGDVVDRYGVPIAVNRQGFTVQIVDAKIKNDELNDMLLKLVNVFEKNKDTYYKSLNKYLTFNPIAYGSSIDKSETKIQKWKSDMVLKTGDINLLSTPEDVFRYFRDVKFKINKKYSDEDAYKIMTIRYEILIRGYSTLNSLRLANDVKDETVAQLEERHNEFPGVTTDIEPVRKYLDAKLAAHVIGYVGVIDADKYKELKDNYDMNDIIGKSGIELAEENDLKGSDGTKTIEEDIRGRQTEEINADPALPGSEVVLTLDMKLQKVAMESLEKNIKKIAEMGGKNNFGDANAGAVVAMDVNNGEVLAMASYPSYDPSIFLAGPEDKVAEQAKKDMADPKNDTKPAFNRAIQGTYAPGSTFKPITAIAGLQEGVITPETVIFDSGKTNIGGKDFFCLEFKNGSGAHGALTLTKALETSCNIYFHEVGNMTKIDNIDKWAKFFGLSEKTGIDIPGESKGVLASIDFKKKAFNDAWRPADTAQAAIGQLYNSFTPLQLTNYISTLANGGRRYIPHLVKRVVKYDGSLVKETKPEYEQIPVDKDTINAVKNGMVAVTEQVDGTAVGAFLGFPYKVAGKTGTAETGNEANHSSNALFVCYAPADNPQIAVAVVVERGAWGANTAPIARDILAEYFHLNNKDNIDDKVKTDDAVLTR